ncbi:peptide ABC transporter substrate-binding protein [Clostridium sp.]|uniref:peptide ABC transporter substrate-binding protein n=1 Tax=Clostridium sp. TaxID=1506 RepID=UPI003D6C90D8
MKKILCGMLAFMMMLTSGCVEKKVKPSTSRKYLVYNLGELPSDLSMADNDNARQKDLLLALFEGLVREDKYGKIVPAMAEYYISEDKIGYTFKLRENIHYSDGTVIKARDFVKFFLDTLLEKDNIYAKELYCIFGAKDFSMGKVNVDGVAIAAKDDFTLEIRLNSPNDYFLNILSNPVFTLRENNLNLKNWKDNYEEIKYSGPFIIKDVNQDGEITLRKNEDYWRAKQIVSNEMLFTSIKDEEKALADFETTEITSTSKIDVFVSPPISEVISLSMENKTEVIPSQTMYYLTFNLKTKNEADEKDILDLNFRNAISSTIDRELIIQTVSKDLAVPAINYTQFSGGDVDNSKLIFNVFGDRDKGKEYLKNSTFDKKKLTIIYESENFDTKISKEIAQYIDDNLDIDVVCTGYEKDELVKVIMSGNYDIVFSKIDDEYGDVYKFFSRWTSNSSYNIYGYNNLEYDKIIESAIMENNNKNKIEMYKDAQQILAKDLPCIPVYIGNTIICKKENIKDIYTTKNGNLVFDYAYKEEGTTVK